MINKSLKYIKAGIRADKGNRIDIVRVEIIRIKLFSLLLVYLFICNTWTGINKNILVSRNLLFVKYIKSENMSKIK